MTGHSTQQIPAPLVTVICIFLDEERFLPAALASVMAQTCTDWELLLVDDGSRDGSPAHAQALAGGHPGKVRYLAHAGHANRGMSASRNLGLAHARGEFIAFIDGDDIWRPDKLERQLALFAAHPEAQLVCGAFRFWRSWDGGEDEVWRTGIRQDALSFPPDTALQLYPLGQAHAVAPSDALVRRDTCTAVGGFEDPFTGLYEDQAFFAKLYLTVPIYCSSACLTDYRRHAGSCVIQSHRDGTYRAARGRFLDWLAGWVEARPIAGKPRVQRAIARERWKLRHRLAGRLLGAVQARLHALRMAGRGRANG